MKQHKVKLLKTLGIYLGMLAHGFGMGITGPSMLDLQIKTSSTLDEITFMILGRAAGLGFGSVLNPFILRMVGIEVLLASALAAAAVFEVLVPFNYNVWGVVATFFINGICIGIFETSCNILIVRIWEKKCPSFIQALYFCFGLGAFISPLFVRPFLLTIQEGSGLSLWTPSDVKVQHAYYIVGAAFAAASVFFFYVTWCHKEPNETETCESGNDTTRNNSHSDKPAESPVKSDCNIRNIILLTLIYFVTAMIMFMYCGIEVSVAQFVTPFVVESDLHLETKTGALMSSVYWGTFTFFRLTTIFYINYIGPRNNIIMAIVITLLSNVFLVPFGTSIEWCLWVGISLNGIGMSSIFGSIFGYIGTHITLTSALTSIMLCSACVGQSVIPLAISSALQQNPDYFVWITFFCCIAMAALFLFLIILLKLYGRDNKK